MEHLTTARADDPGGRTTTDTGAGSAGRRCALAVAAAVVVVAVGGRLVACDGRGTDAGTARSTTSTAPVTTSPAREATPAVTGAPAAPTTRTRAATPAGHASSATTTTAATAHLPTSPEGYAPAAFDAWLHGNDRRLRRLATGPVADFLAARTPHEPGQWSGPACDSAAGSTYCTWTQHDAELVIRVHNEDVFLGRKHAVAAAFFTVPAGGVAVWPFTTTVQATNAQSGVDEGHQPWLLDPPAVAVSYAGAELGWHDAGIERVQPSLYRVTDPASGARADLTLAQPERPGPGGIWAVVRAGSTT